MNTTRKSKSLLYKKRNHIYKAIHALSKSRFKLISWKLHNKILNVRNSYNRWYLTFALQKLFPWFLKLADGIISNIFTGTKNSEFTHTRDFDVWNKYPIFDSWFFYFNEDGAVNYPKSNWHVNLFLSPKYFFCLKIARGK